MADKLESAPQGAKIFDLICLKLGWARGSLGGIKKICRWKAAGVPAVDAGSQATYPVATGDLAWDYTNEHAYIATVAPAANTAATFVKLHA